MNFDQRRQARRTRRLHTTLTPHHHTGILIQRSSARRHQSFPGALRPPTHQCHHNHHRLHSSVSSLLGYCLLSSRQPCSPALVVCICVRRWRMMVLRGLDTALYVALPRFAWLALDTRDAASPLTPSKTFKSRLLLCSPGAASHAPSPPPNTTVKPPSLTRLPVYLPHHRHQQHAKGPARAEGSYPTPSHPSQEVGLLPSSPPSPSHTFCKNGRRPLPFLLPAWARRRPLGATHLRLDHLLVHRPSRCRPGCARCRMAERLRSTLESLVGRLDLPCYFEIGSIKHGLEIDECCVGEGKAVVAVGLGVLFLLAGVIYLFFIGRSSSSRSRSSSGRKAG